MNALPFEVSVTMDGDRAVIHVKGELDYGTAPALRDAIRQSLDADAQSLTFGFREVTFIDSEGLKLLMEAHRELHFRDSSITVEDCSRACSRIFALAGIAGYFGIAYGHDPVFDK